MADFKEIVVGTVIGLVNTVEAEYATKLIAALKTDNEDYETDLKALYHGLTRLKKFTDKSKSKIDDVLVNPLYNAILDAAEDDNIELE
jgi:hypothetical protein